jgi:hypothetical protein
MWEEVSREVPKKEFFVRTQQRVPIVSQVEFFVRFARVSFVDAD